jgi:uncharacterized protein YbbC (DUF1343 family)
VVEAIDTVDGSHSYWALRHPALCPTFTIAPALLSNSLRRANLPEGTADARAAVRTRPPAHRPATARASARPPCGPAGSPGIGQRDLTHALDALAALPDLRLAAAFGPQHGLRGDKQDNMVESPEFLDPVHHIPVFSLYGTVRRPTPAMMDSFDVLLIDLQDLGCRIYTFITTLRYVLEAAASMTRRSGFSIVPTRWDARSKDCCCVPAGRASSAPGPLPMRHGLTMGELACWFVSTLDLDVDCTVIKMHAWSPDAAPGYGWPIGERSWVNPSPNAPNLSMARCYAGTVMLEGSTLSEGRGTTRPLELFGAPDIDARQLIACMYALAPHWLLGCRLRECWFEPTFHKHAGKLCHGVQIHVDDGGYEHATFRPWRLQSLAFKACGNCGQITSCGAILPTNTNSIGWPSI